MSGSPSTTMETMLEFLDTTLFVAIKASNASQVQLPLSAASIGLIVRLDSNKKVLLVETSSETLVRLLLKSWVVPLLHITTGLTVLSMDTLTSTLQVNVTLFPVNKEPLTVTVTIGAGSVHKGLNYNCKVYCVEMSISYLGTLYFITGPAI